MHPDYRVLGTKTKDLVIRPIPAGSWIPGSNAHTIECYTAIAQIVAGWSGPVLPDTASNQRR
ncbi:hypothetical protein BN2476_390034 [Paraburkholderia piptadeniae]|uniref:Uncharacterized protein n=1 Tax=Paraburkholderia piptadeniae TaxID=1701573 RepID=A0A1N7SAL0_9BURK|nr:hypothetical protein BN2476_390034 [Paraburkholderia piptadeniae]